MHEVSLIYEVLLIVEEAAKEKDLSSVTLVKLVFGKSLCVMPEALEFAFQSLKRGITQNAVLEWEQCPGRDFYISYIEGD